MGRSWDLRSACKHRDSLSTHLALNPCNSFYIRAVVAFRCEGSQYPCVAYLALLFRLPQCFLVSNISRETDNPKHMQGRFIYAPPIVFTMWTNALTTENADHGPPNNSLDRSLCCNLHIVSMTRICRSVTCCEGFLQGGYGCAVNMRVYPAGFMEINARNARSEQAWRNWRNSRIQWKQQSQRARRRAAHAARLLETRRVVSQAS